MFHHTVSALYRAFAGKPTLRVYGKAAYERDWSIIDIYATPLRNCRSRWPLFRGTCITWTSSIIAVGCDFAEEFIREQADHPASRDRPVVVSGGRLRNLQRRQAAGALPWASASEIMAHECGHTGQGRRMGFLYWMLGAAFTLCREGDHFWNHFENKASETGILGGIVDEQAVGGEF